MLFLKRLKTTLLCLLGVGMAACSAGGDSAEPTQTPVTTGNGVQVFSSGLITPNPTPTLIPVTAVPNFGPAPEIENEVWLNTETALPIASLKGKVVLVEFWTFG